MHILERLNHGPSRSPRRWRETREPTSSKTVPQSSPSRKIVVVRHRLRAKPAPPPVDLTALCLQPPSISMNCAVLPQVGYTNVEAVPELCHSGISSGSSSSVATNVDDGLSAWGLPKVISEPYDNTEKYLEEADSSSTVVQEIPCPLKEWQLLCMKVVVLVYTAVLVKKLGTKVPRRYVRPLPKLGFGAVLRMIC